MTDLTNTPSESLDDDTTERVLDDTGSIPSVVSIVSDIVIDTVAEEGAQLPLRKHYDDAGADLHSFEDVLIPAGEQRMVGTGVSIKLPEGTVGFITPRSGLAGKHGLTVLNAPGTVDAGYTGELKVILINHSKEDYTVNVGERIAQLVVQPVLFPAFRSVESLEPAGEGNGLPVRGAGGFGSTGR